MHRGKFKFLISMILALLIAVLTLPVDLALAADGNNGKGQLKFSDNITPAQKKAAAALFQAQGGVTAAQPTLVADPNTGYLVPDYFADANWAYSPLPSGSIGSITVISGGIGYSATANVTITDVYGPGTGATANVTVVNGVITAITVTAAGTGYVAPVVTIEDSTGTGAAASAALDLATLKGGLRKFMDSLPGLGPTNNNTLGQYIPVAIADNLSYPGCDYYEIAVVEFSEKMHSDLPPTRLRGYVQLETPFNYSVSKHVVLTYPNGTQIMKGDGSPAYAVDNPHYLGPAIVATGETEGRPARPVRVKFYNLLSTGDGGNLFLPVDTTVMGSGMGPLDMPGMPGMKESYTQNRATLHLHGTDTVWISDGTPHQWITPAGESTSYPQGVSVRAVPDMGVGTPAADTGNPRDGTMTFYYTNQHSARLMFYHDHSYGITRLNVYAGEAAAYLVTDEVENDLINGTNNTGVNPDRLKILPGIGIPLVIQDKTWVDTNTILKSDPTWAWGTGAIDPNTGFPAPVTGDLWYPHVYVPAQNPWDPGGSNPFGRWHYAAWFWPPATLAPDKGPQPNPYCLPYPPGQMPGHEGDLNFWDNSAAPWEAPFIPGTPNPSSPGEAFMDTPVVNGTAYPYLVIEPKAYRFRILNAADDRFFNLQWYIADPTVVTVDNRTNTEVRMVPSPDGREGGIPDPAMKGPDWIQIGTEGGFLPKPVVVPSQPVTWNGDPTLFNFGNVQNHSLLLGTAERADVIVDFSKYAGQTLILYNDAPAAFPALVPQYDYYTGNPDRMDIGGAPSTKAGFGPNVRTVMQVRVAGTTGGTSVGSVSVTAGGSGYTAPAVSIVGAATTNATATAYGAVDRVALNNMGDGGYTLPVTVNITAPQAGGIQATATATVTNGYITAITVTSGGSGYVTAPAVTISGGAGNLAAARAALTITSVNVTDNGSGYAAPPVVVFTDTGTGAGATAVANLNAAGTAIPPYNVDALNAVFQKTTNKRGVFEVSQDAPIIPSAEYNSAYNANYLADAFIRQHDTTASVNIGGQSATVPIQAKALQDEMGEVFDDYGRMMVQLGLELPVTTPGAQNFMMYGYASPPVEIIKGVYASQIGTAADGVQIWRITHNGVDTHTIHTHLYNAQLINRVAWDGFVYPPEPSELGWKETFRVNPLEHTIIALRAVIPDVPFDVPYSSRLIDPTMPDGMMLKWPGVAGFFDPLGDPVTFYGAGGDIMNHSVNFGWEYVYHCHLLAHEEMDMMHGVVIAAPPKAPTNLTVALNGSRAVLTWRDNSSYEAGFTIQRAQDPDFTVGVVTFNVGANVTTFSDSSLRRGVTYYYRVMANSPVFGDTMTPNFPTMSVQSPPTVTVSITR